MRTDLSAQILASPVINPAAAITGNGTTTGATIDAQGYEALVFVAQSGTITDGAFALHVYAGNAANMSDEVELTGADLTDPNGAPSFASTDDNKVKRIGVSGKPLDTYRYFRLKAVQSGATSGGILGAIALLGNPRYSPVAMP